MTIERDILEKLKSIKDEIAGPKEVVKQETKSLTPKRENIKTESAILLLFDATGSMARFWLQTRDIINEMIERITEVGTVKIKCVAYRDYCDDERLFEKSKWSTRAGPLLEFIGNIHCDGGGDAPEAVEDALRLANLEEGVTRVILIGDAPPHSLNRSIKESINLSKKNIPVFAFRVGQAPDTKESFRQIAKASNGSYADLKNYGDLLDMMSVTIVHDMGGHIAVKEYINKYGTSDDVKEFSKSLPSYNK